MDHQSLISGIIPILFPTVREEGFAFTSSNSGALEKVHSELEVEWKILNVFTVDQNCKCFVSPSFHFLEAEWRLLLFGEFTYPKSDSDNPGNNPSLVLLRNEDYCSPVKYTFEWMTLDGTVKQLLKGVMRSEQKRGDYCRIKLSEVLPQQNNNAVPMNVTIKFTVRLETTEKVSSERRNYKNLETLSSNFTELFSTKQCYDVTLRVRDREFKAHKAVLVARSPVFASMLESRLLDRQSAIVTLADCDPDSFELFLEYLYRGTIETMCTSSAIVLFEIAVKYDVPELQELCTEYLIGNLTSENFCDLLVFADKFGDEKLMSAVQGFFKENVQLVCETPRWQSLLENNGCLANKLLRS